MTELPVMGMLFESDSYHWRKTPRTKIRPFNIMPPIQRFKVASMLRYETSNIASQA